MIIDTLVESGKIDNNSIVAESIKARGYAVIVLVDVGIDPTRRITTDLMVSSNIIMSMDGTVYKAE